jgi:hypothetical protein
VLHFPEVEHNFDVLLTPGEEVVAAGHVVLVPQSRSHRCEPQEPGSTHYHGTTRRHALPNGGSHVGRSGRCQ